MRMRPPHLGHLPGISMTMGLVKVQSGKPGQARKWPNLPFFTTIWRPQTSQYSSLSTSGTFSFTPSMAVSAACSSWLKSP